MPTIHPKTRKLLRHAVSSHFHHHNLRRAHPIHPRHIRHQRQQSSPIIQHIKLLPHRRHPHRPRLHRRRRIAQIKHLQSPILIEEKQPRPHNLPNVRLHRRLQRNRGCRLGHHHVPPSENHIIRERHILHRHHPHHRQPANRINIIPPIARGKTPLSPSEPLRKPRILICHHPMRLPLRPLRHLKHHLGRSLTRQMPTRHRTPPLFISHLQNQMRPLRRRRRPQFPLFLNRIQNHPHRSSNPSHTRIRCARHPNRSKHPRH